MEHLPKLITDLALILMAAGVVTLLFKRLKQPLVLGYIVAGFLTGPHMPYTPSITDASSLGAWADIGVIFIMFTLGLEFSFKKIVKMGGGPIIAACTIIFCMIGLGSLTGHLFGWSRMDSLFLGGMLAMSSTTIIYKAFDDMGLRQQRFSKLVLSVLVLEDILGILLMVMLSTMAVSREFEGKDLMNSLLQLGFCLLVWFIVGVFLIPLFLRKNRKWMNKETLLIVSLGLCFAMVVLAVKMGYSAAFGAFMMGSILAETVEAESINKLVSPVKDLFGAIFFVSVGMLVDPNVLVAYWFPIIIITTTILIGQCIFGTGGFLLSGQPLRVAMQCGFSMTQIGEFAFIIASLGVGLGVTSHFLYPIVVAVSVITTFSTPYMIRLSTPAYAKIERMLPDKMHQLLSELSPGGPTGKDETAWRRLLLALGKQVVSYSVLSIAVIALSFSFLLPFVRDHFTHWYGNAFCGVFTLLAISPFLRAIVMRKNHSDDFTFLWQESRMNRFPLIFTVLVRFIMANTFVFYIINFLSPFSTLLHWFASIGLMVIIILSRFVKNGSIKLEHTFLQNLRSREMQAEVMGKVKPLYANHLLSRDVHLTDLELPMNTRWAGTTLLDLELGHRYGIMVASILRGGQRINIPGANTRIYPGDKLQVIGDDVRLKALAERMDAEIIEEEVNIEEREIILECLEIKETSPFIGKTVSQSGVRNKYHCMLVGFEDNNEQLGSPTPNRVFNKGDLVWLVGERKSIKRILGAKESKA
ncbi:MAG: cation:proton antiporter [Bacteroidaceae bacterium]